MGERHISDLVSDLSETNPDLRSISETDDRARFVDLGPWPTFDRAAGLCAQPEHKHVEFFGLKTLKAKALCMQCPLKRECAEYAIPIPALHGVWGGTTMEGRMRIRVERGIGRVPTLSVTQTSQGWYAAFKGMGRKRSEGVMPLVSSGTTKLRTLQNLAKKVVDLENAEQLLEMIAAELADGQAMAPEDKYGWGVKPRYEVKKYGSALWAPREEVGYSPPTKAVVGARLGSMNG